MSQNIWDAEKQELVKTAGNVNLDDSVVSEESAWSSKKIHDSLVDKADADKVVPLVYETTVTDANDLPDGITTAYNLTNRPYVGFVTYETISLENNPAFRVQEATEVEGGKKYKRYKNNGTWSAWHELATMDKVVPQVIIENKTTDDARTIIQNSWGAFPTNNSLARIETSVFTWSAQIYKHDNSWGTIILNCYADNKDSYIGKKSNGVWHWYKIGLTEV